MEAGELLSQTVQGGRRRMRMNALCFLQLISIRGLILSDILVMSLSTCTRLSCTEVMDYLSGPIGKIHT